MNRRRLISRITRRVMRGLKASTGNWSYKVETDALKGWMLSISNPYFTDDLIGHYSSRGPADRVGRLATQMAFKLDGEGVPPHRVYGQLKRRFRLRQWNPSSWR
jgi:hypothetical protein